MIVLFTDFGLAGPYVGQMHAVLQREAPGIPVIDLMHDAPACAPRPAAYLLAALCREFPKGSVIVGVVDPGVGSARRGVILAVDGRWFIGPDNGLFNIVALQGAEVCWRDINYQPARLSRTFHGRDLFAPVAACIARGDGVPGDLVDTRERVDSRWATDLAEVIYLDGFGNAMTGIRASSLSRGARLRAGGATMTHASTYSEVGHGACFWYENSCGLVELAVNQGSAARQLGLAVGDPIEVQVTPD